MVPWPQDCLVDGLLDGNNMLCHLLKRQVLFIHAKTICNSAYHLAILTLFFDFCSLSRMLNTSLCDVHLGVPVSPNTYSPLCVFASSIVGSLALVRRVSHY